MDFLRDGFDIIDRAQDITCVRHGYQASLVAQELSQDLWVELRVLLVVWFVPLEIRTTVFSKLDPGCYISFVVQFRYYDFISGLDVLE